MPHETLNAKRSTSLARATHLDYNLSSVNGTWAEYIVLESAGAFDPKLPCTPYTGLSFMVGYVLSNRLLYPMEALPS